MVEVGRFAISPETAFLLMKILHLRLADYVASGGVLPKADKERGEISPSKIISEVEEFLRRNAN